MSNSREYTNKTLNIKRSDDDDGISLVFSGRSRDRHPSEFLGPIFDEVLNEIKGGERKAVLDFRPLEYMNSSTITPIVKMLNNARRDKCRVEIIYHESLKWQNLSFSALTVFTDDAIEVKGV